MKIISTFKGLKKTIVYTSENSKAFCEGALNMISQIKKQSPSAVLEDLIEQALLPDQEDARAICKQIYSGNYILSDIFDKIFSLYAMGIDYQARWKNGKDFVIYFHEIIIHLNFPTDSQSEGYRTYFCSNLDQIYNRLKSEYSISIDTSTEYTNPAKYAESILRTAHNDPKNFEPALLTTIILDYWDVLGNNTYTYRALGALARLLQNDILDNPESRQKLINIIKKVSKDWN